MPKIKLPDKARLSSTFGDSVRKYLPNKNERPTSFLSLFKYAKPLEKFLAATGLVAACASGFCLPMFIVLYGEFTTALIDRKTPNATFHKPFLLPWFGGGRANLNGSVEDIASAIREDSQAYGIGTLVVAFSDVIFSFICISFLNYACLRQISRIRRILVRSVLEKDMSWYDVNSDANFAVNLTEDLNNMQEGMGEKISLFVCRVMSFTICVIFALLSGWKLTLVVIACVPFIILSNGIVSRLQATMVVKEQKAYANASGVAEEAFSSIKTVIAFGGEGKEVERYQGKLKESLLTGIKRALMSGIGGGIMWFIIYAVYALAFYYGVTLVLESRENNNIDNTPASIIIVMFGVIAGSMSMGQCLPYLEAFSIARGSGTSVFNVINTKSPINPFSTNGKKLPSTTGNITFKNVHFNYPARSAVHILKGLDLDIKSGSKVALVGSSGCGKSTCVQLIQRLYDPLKGAVLLDGVDLRELNIGWLRSQIGVVSQEPLLFATTIYENILYGNITASKKEVEEAAKIANAHDFISKLPEGYNTMIGQRGTQLSGGQKQRIAIARAVVRNPNILLLDEATSALDSSNEAAVQKALDNASMGRTTLVVAHRLSTVKNSDRIVVISDGQFVESGTHDELIEQKGQYYKLLTTQNATLESAMSEGDEKGTKGEYTQFAERRGSKIDDDLPKINEEEEEKNEAEENESLKSGSILRILSYSKPEWFSILVGSLATIMVGSSCPLSAILLGEIYGVLSESDSEYVRTETNFYSLMMLVLAISVGVAIFLQLYTFGHVASHLTNRLRILTFSAILKQEPGWFDREENKIGALSARLSGSCADIQAVAGSSLSIVLQGLTTMFIGFFIAFSYSWQMTLVTSCGLPILFFGVYYEFYVLQGQNLLDKKNIESATKVAVEAISGIRTVASLGREGTITEKYDKELESGESVMMRKAFVRGVIYGVGQSATFLGYSMSLWYGGTLVAEDSIHYKNVIKVSEALLFGVWLLGQSLAFAPSYGKAKLSAGRLFRILDRPCGLKESSVATEKQWQPNGLIDYSKVHFVYPNRPEVQVLRDLNLQIKPGTSVALAGPSGCGKSTIVQLLQRFYDPDSGSISIDNRSLNELPTAQLRNQMSIVAQEPVLFNLTIGENIAYGDNTRTVPHDEIITAAKTANIHSFIVSLPAGYNTNLGKGGTQLSGGQKQRIAIARALIRNPKILLLDEATSALDTASEAVVQAALDDAATGRTTISVGHRPAAIARADVIYVLNHGRVVEKGTYEQLVSSKGFYASLNQN